MSHWITWNLIFILKEAKIYMLLLNRIELLKYLFTNLYYFPRMLKHHYANSLLLIGMLKSDLYANFLRRKHNQQNHTSCMFSNVFSYSDLSDLLLYVLHYLKAVWHIYYLWRANLRTKLLLTCCDRLSKKFQVQLFID